MLGRTSITEHMISDVRLFPMYVAPLHNIQAAKRSEQHEVLMERDILDEWLEGMLTVFVSHAWFSYSQPNPDGKKLALLQN